MPITPTYPGVYVEEIPSGVRPIAGVATSVAAFVDYFKQGPMNKAVHIFSWDDFERVFGGLDRRSEGSYAIQQFFVNGGREAYVVRTASGDATAVLRKAGATINNTITGGGPALKVEAISEGRWGNDAHVRVDPAPGENEFNLVVTQYNTTGSRTTIVSQEIFRNLSMDDTKPNFVERIVNDPRQGSKLVKVTKASANLPALSGTTSEELTEPVTFTAPTTFLIKTSTSDAGKSGTLNFRTSGAQKLVALAVALEEAIRNAAPGDPAFAGATVRVTGKRLRVMPGGTDAKSKLIFTNTPANTAVEKLLLRAGDVSEAQITISGELAPEPTIPATPSLKVKVGGGAAKTVSPTFGAAALPGPVPLATIAQQLQEVIRAEGAELANVEVFALGSRLVAIPRTATASDKITFTANGANTLAADLKLTGGEETQRAATLSGAHATNPEIPASPRLDATIAGTTRSVAVTFGSETLPKALPITTVGPALEAALRSAVTGNDDFNKASVVVRGDRLLVIPGGATPANTFSFAASGATTTADTLKLSGTGAMNNVAEYRAGRGNDCRVSSISRRDWRRRAAAERHGPSGVTVGKERPVRAGRGGHLQPPVPAAGGPNGHGRAERRGGGVRHLAGAGVLREAPRVLHHRHAERRQRPGVDQAGGRHLAQTHQRRALLPAHPSTRSAGRVPAALHRRKRHGGGAVCPDGCGARGLEGAGGHRHRAAERDAVGRHAQRPRERDAQPARRSIACAHSPSTATSVGARGPRWAATSRRTSGSTCRCGASRCTSKRACSAG